MGKTLLEQNPSLRALYALGSDILGYDLEDICLNADADTLSQTRYAQPAIYVTSLALLEAAKAQGLTYAGAAGHSLGEYAAMTACGILTPEAGFRALRARAAAMDEAAKAQDSAMFAILRLSAQEVTEACAEVEGYVLPVNFNAPQQTVIAGERAAAEAAAAACTARGGKAMPLKVAAAFHSKLMQPAADALEPALQDIPFAVPEVPLYCNLTGDVLEAETDMPHYCALHCVSPVRFTDSLRAMQRDGFDTYLELGPKRVLSKLATQTLEGITARFAGDEKSLAEALA